MIVSGPIILVEDDEEDQFLFKEALNSLGITNELVICNDGVEALQYLNETTRQPFLILCDINMPKMDGFQLRIAINASEYLKKKSIPFIFHSTAAIERDINRAFELTVQGYFQKTNSFEKFVALLGLIINYWKECKHPTIFT